MQRKQRPLHPRTPHRSFHRIRQLVPTCLGPRESSSKRHFNLFIRFCSAQGRDHATDRHTDRPRYSVRSNRQHLDIAAVAAAPTEKVLITAATHVRSGKYCSHAGYFMDSIMDWSMSPKLCLLRGWALPSSTWFRGPTRVHTPITISIGSSVLAQCIVLTNAQTSVTSATIGRIDAPCRPLHSKFEN